MIALVFPVAAQAKPLTPLTVPQHSVKSIIRSVFPHHYKEAQRVAYCESTYHKTSQNGQYLGVFQLSSAWRHYFKHIHPNWHDVAFTPSENIAAAHAIFKSQRWGPWSCGYRAYDGGAPR